MKRLLTWFFCIGWTAACAAAANSDRPNVLFIFTDQQQSGMMSCAGNPWLKTPAMDSIARSGARFERAYCVNPVCVPSRTGILTGYTPSRFRMQSNAEVGTTRIPGDVQQKTLGWLFRDAGYETVYGGKTHVPGKIEGYGFDVLTGDMRGELASECAGYLKKPHDRPFLLVASFINPHDICYMAIEDFARDSRGSSAKKAGAKAAGAAKTEAREARKASVAVQQMETAAQRPAGVSDEEFFAKLCPPAPANLEPQIDAPEAVDASLGPSGGSFRRHAMESWSVEQWRVHRWAYCRLTEQVDREIGQVLEALREAGLEEKTLIVFSSDHGDMDGSHRLEHKSLFFEEATRVPFIVSLKGVTKPGTVDRQHLVSTGLDLIPTLCDYAGIAPPAGLMGRSVRALAEGRDPGSWRPYVAVETHYGRMIRSDRYKYAVYESGQRREQLVDLAKDPGETRNVAGEPAMTEVLKQHRAMMREWISTNRDDLAAGYLLP